MKWLDISELATLISIWLNSININLFRDMISILHLQRGKVGGLFLTGPPDTGKSLIIQLLCSGYEKHEIGLVSRGTENRFWLMDTRDRNIIVAEEYITNDVDADHLKLHLEGSEFASIEIKNGGRLKLQHRQPWLITSNFPICVMCPRQYGPISARLLTVVMIPHELIPVIANKFYKLNKDDMYKVFIELKKLYKL